MECDNLTSPPDDQCIERLRIPKGLRVRYLARSTPEVFRTIERGVVFLMAWWSGPSISAWTFLKEFLLKVDSQRCLEVVVLDIDGMSGFENSSLGPTVAGAGETTWVRKGRVLTTSWVLWLGQPELAKCNTELLVQID